MARRKKKKKGSGQLAFIRSRVTRGKINRGEQGLNKTQRKKPKAHPRFRRTSQVGVINKHTMKKRPEENFSDCRKKKEKDHKEKTNYSILLEANQRGYSKETALAELQK